MIETKAVVQLLYISEKRPVSGAVTIARRGKTLRAVLPVLTSFMVETRVARRDEAPSSEGERKKTNILDKFNI